MRNRTFSTALILTSLLFSIFSCTKTDDSEILAPPVVDQTPSIPDGSRIIIHFGTSTQRGCMYSFSNCIWIGWGTEATNFDGRMAMQFDKGDEASQYFGQYFPLTSDFTVDAATSQALGIEEQVIPAGFYPIREAGNGLPTNKKAVDFNPALGQPVAGLVNPNNSQDNVGQLHNLAVQVILNDHRDAIKSLNGDKKAIQAFVTEKMFQFMAEAELPLTATEQQYVSALDLNRDYGNYAARLGETRLSANDKKVLQGIFDEAAAMPIQSPQELSNFVLLMTEHENRLANDETLDNRKTVLSMLSVLKYSRYYWYWKSISSPTPGGAEPAQIPDWVWADIIGMELGGPVVSAVASVIVYLDHH